MERPGDLIRAVRSSVDCFVVNYGMARACAEDLAGSQICLRTDVYKPDVAAGSTKLFGANEARLLDACSMMQMLYPGHADEARIIRECAETIREGVATDLPVIVEALPVGLGIPAAYTIPAVGFAARQAAELGAAVVKTAFPSGANASEFRSVVDGCFVPLITLGGAALGDDRALLGMVREALDAGAVGIAIGRNVWQHPDPARIAGQLHALVHRDLSVDEALKLS
jgi:DhnA family fructose-bisphosphate aldolase class Ia